jgi:predicted nucleic-acid-binding Zn-ribbon protein
MAFGKRFFRISAESGYMCITCDRCGHERMFNEAYSAQRGMLIRDILDRMRHEGCCGGREGRAAHRHRRRQQPPGAEGRAARQLLRHAAGRIPDRRVGKPPPPGRHVRPLRLEPMPSRAGDTAARGECSKLCHAPDRHAPKTAAS